MAFDMASVVAELGDAKLSVLAVGLVVFGVEVAFRTYRWLRDALEPESPPVAEWADTHLMEHGGPDVQADEVVDRDYLGCPKCGSWSDKSEVMALSEDSEAGDAGLEYLRCPDCGESSPYMEWGTGEGDEGVGVGVDDGSGVGADYLDGADTYMCSNCGWKENEDAFFPTPDHADHGMHCCPLCGHTDQF